MDYAELLSNLVNDPLAQLFVAALIIYAVPNGFLKKIPIVGDLLEIALRQWALKVMKDKELRNSIIEKQVDRIVADKEQAIKNKRIDPASARNEAIEQAIEMFKGELSPEEASLFIENSVHKLPSSIGELYPLDVTDE